MTLETVLQTVVASVAILIAKDIRDTLHRIEADLNDHDLRLKLLERTDARTSGGRQKAR
jgi:hypothetical protein